MHITRRELLKAAGVAAVWTQTDAVADRAAAFIRNYSAEGFHRTATAVDNASGERLARAASLAAKGRASAEWFELDRIDAGPAFVEIGGRRVEGLPMFDAAFTDGDGVRGAIGAIEGGTDAPIGWVRVAPNVGEVVLRPIRQRSPHRAIVAVTVGGHPGLCPVNAQYFRQPFGPPVLQVGSEHLDAIESAARRGDEVRVVAHAVRTHTRAANIVVDVEGTRRDLAPLCVMTPRSGWHYNASERGGGLVCWLEVLRAVAAARPLRTVRFVASSGHELGHLGLLDYLRRHEGLERDAAVWLHFGANIGAAGGKPATLTCSNEALESIAARAFGSPELFRINPAGPDRVRGEAATIREGGGRFVSLIGQNDWFHNPGDRWPAAVDLGAVARFATISSGLALELANQV